MIKLDNKEKQIVKVFLSERIPAIYKLDTTDNILFIEHVSYDLCEMLLKRKEAKKVTKEFIQNEIREYSIFLSQLDILAHDDKTNEHLKLLMSVFNIFIKHFL